MLRSYGQYLSLLISGNVVSLFKTEHDEGEDVDQGLPGPCVRDSDKIPARQHRRDTLNNEHVGSCYAELTQWWPCIMYGRAYDISSLGSKLMQGYILCISIISPLKFINQNLFQTTPWGYPEQWTCTCVGSCHTELTQWWPCIMYGRAYDISRLGTKLMIIPPLKNFGVYKPKRPFPRFLCNFLFLFFYLTLNFLFFSQATTPLPPPKKNPKG